MGVAAGAIGGWSLIWAYLGISIAGVTGFSIFADKLLDMVGLHLPPVVLFALCVGTAWYCAWKNVQLSVRNLLRWCRRFDPSLNSFLQDLEDDE